MKKDKVYSLAVFYQQTIEKENGKPRKLSPSHARYFRNAFKPFMVEGQEIENDRKEIVKTINKDSTKEEIEKANEELKKLWDEEVEVVILPDLEQKLEEAKINITTAESELLFD